MEGVVSSETDEEIEVLRVAAKLASRRSKSPTDEAGCLVHMKAEL